MAAIFIESDNAKNIKLLTQLAEQLGVSVNKLSTPQTKSLHLAMPARKDHRTTAHSAGATPNVFRDMRRRMKNKLSNEQIDEQVKSLRDEWQRDI